MDEHKRFKEKFSLLTESQKYLQKYGSEIMALVNRYFKDLPQLFKDFRKCLGDREFKGLQLFIEALKDYPTIYFAFLHALSYDLAVHYNLVKHKRKGMHDISGFELGCIAMLSAIRQVSRDFDILVKTFEPLFPI